MKKRNVITSTIVIAVTAIILALALTACAPKEAVEEETIATLDTTPEETKVVETEPTVEETEAPTEAPTEPEETEPEEAAPKATSTPAMNTGNHTNSNTSGTVNSTPNTPDVTESPAITPVQPAPAEPVPEVTAAPAEPKPTEHVHNWQEVYHEEVSHEVWWIVCRCGARFATLDEISAHNASFLGSEEWINHSSYGETCETVVDTPAYSTWACACGATSDTQP